MALTASQQVELNQALPRTNALSLGNYLASATWEFGTTHLAGGSANISTSILNSIGAVNLLPVVDADHASNAYGMLFYAITVASTATIEVSAFYAGSAAAGPAEASRCTAATNVLYYILFE